MSAEGRKASAILAMVGGSIVIVAGFFLIFVGFAEVWLMGILLTIVSALGLLGGILLLRDKKAGGILAIIGGATGIGLSAVLFWLILTLPYGSYFLPITPILFTCHAIVLSSGITGVVGNSK